MKTIEWEELWRRKKLQTLRLMEVSDLTGQLAQASSRRDQVSVEVLLAMRDGPLRQIMEMEEAIGNYLLKLPEEDAIRAREILDGSPAVDRAEEALCDQVAQYRRLLASVVSLDKQISLRMGGKRSFYRLLPKA